MELAEERARLVALPNVEQALSELANTTRSQIMAIPPRIAPELVVETSRVMIQAKEGPAPSLVGNHSWSSSGALVPSRF
jgi:hypothetical protein